MSTVMLGEAKWLPVPALDVPCVLRFKSPHQHNEALFSRDYDRILLGG
jgi:hypothetical protein